MKYLQELIKSWRFGEARNNPQMQKEKGVKPSADVPDQAWQEFFRIGDALADCDTPDIDTLTSAVLSMRR